MHLDETQPRIIPMSFDFLDAGDGCVVEVIHEGASAASVRGTVRGASLRSRGGLGLTPANLLLVAEPNAVRRWRARYSLKRTLASLAPVLLALVLMATVALRASVREPVLVRAEDYELGTLDGQRNFAEEVQDVGLQDSTQLFWLFGARFSLCRS